MSYQNISASLSAADKLAIQQATQTIKSKLPFLVNLNKNERQKLRKMGPVRTSYVQDVYKAAVSNADAIPSGFKMTEYSKDASLVNDMSDIMSWITPVAEGIGDTYMALGGEMMKQTDECYGYLKVAAKKSSNVALTDTVAKIAAQLKQERKGVPPTA